MKFDKETKISQEPFRLYNLDDNKVDTFTVKLNKEERIEFESWKETIDTLEENPDLRKEVKEADEEYKKGQTCSLDDFLAQKGFIKAK